MSAPSPFTFTLVIEKGMPRLDQALLEKLRESMPGISRNQLKTLFDEKRVFLNQVSRAPSWNLLPGRYEIRIIGMEMTSGSNQAQPSTRGSFLSICYEDANLLILNKLSGIPSVPHSSDETETAVGSALAHFPALAGIGRGELEPGLLHRLDTGTSGLLAFAKTSEAFERFHLAWKTGQVRKIYRAWVYGDASGLCFPMKLELTMAHHPESQKRMIVLPEGVKRKHRGKPLITSTTLLACLNQSQHDGKTYSDLEIEIKTGVMHQIRCTLSHLGFSIVGDPIYRSSSQDISQTSTEVGDTLKTRLLLHAWKLALPIDGRMLEIEAPIPDDFKVIYK